MAAIEIKAVEHRDSPLALAETSSGKTEVEFYGNRKHAT